MVLLNQHKKIPTVRIQKQLHQKNVLEKFFLSFPKSSRPHHYILYRLPPLIPTLPTSLQPTDKPQSTAQLTSHTHPRNNITTTILPILKYNSPQALSTFDQIPRRHRYHAIVQLSNVCQEMYWHGRIKLGLTFDLLARSSHFNTSPNLTTHLPPRVPAPHFTHNIPASLVGMVLKVELVPPLKVDTFPQSAIHHIISWPEPNPLLQLPPR